jgi:hypothetical protein
LRRPGRADSHQNPTHHPELDRTNVKPQARPTHTTRLGFAIPIPQATLRNSPDPTGKAGLMTPSLKLVKSR